MALAETIILWVFKEFIERVRYRVSLGYYKSLMNLTKLDSSKSFYLYDKQSTI